MRKLIRALLIVIAVACFAVALSYPINYYRATQSNSETMDQLAAMREADRETDSPAEATQAAATATPEPTAEPTDEPAPEMTAEPTAAPETTEAPQAEGDATAEPTPVPTPTPKPTPTVDPYLREGALPYTMLEKKEFDGAKDMLPELRRIYGLNPDLIGWLYIPDTVINYPVVQTEDSEYYLTHDFYKQDNINGQIILDTTCDPYTPSYNLVISGHHMRNGDMFGALTDYSKESYWQEHKTVEFDTLYDRRKYVVFAAFYSANYDENEEGFRYNCDIQYKLDAQEWLAEIEENQLYDTGIEVEFGDHFLTLTTCSRDHHREGRFVVVCREIREGETIQ